MSTAEMVSVTESLTGRFMQTAQSGRHVFTLDEPMDIGGNDAGPGPYDLLLMSLGACTSMTLRMYADSKKWPLQRVSVQLRHHKIHAEDCAQCDTKVDMVDEIIRDIQLIGDLSDEQRLRLLEIANKCPVHRTLMSEIRIQTQLLGV